MLGFRRVPIACRSRLKALRGLYARYYNENTPEVRGLRLLGAWLSPSQFEQFNAKAHFDVVGCATGRRYRIHYGTQANVHELDDLGGDTMWVNMALAYEKLPVHIKTLPKSGGARGWHGPRTSRPVFQC